MNAPAKQVVGLPVNQMPAIVSESLQSALRAEIFAFERGQIEKPQVDIKIVHYHAHGVVAREMTAPAGLDITGAIHKYANLNTLSKGEMIIATEDGPVHLKAPCTFVSPPGTKRVAHTLAECVWTCYLGTHETDVDKIAAEFTTNSEQEYLEFAGVLTLEGSP